MAHAADAERACVRGIRVLVVEDEPDIGLIARRVLSRSCAEVDLVRTGAEALARIADPSFQCQVVVIDLGLPDMPGLDVVRHIEKAHPNVAIVVASGSIEPPPCECDVRLLKPYLPQELVEAVTAAILAHDLRPRPPRRSQTGTSLLPV
jgi:DNA-binding response OmpR family regulator